MVLDDLWGVKYYLFYMPDYSQYSSHYIGFSAQNGPDFALYHVIPTSNCVNDLRNGLSTPENI